MNKEELIYEIIKDYKQNIYESEDIIFLLVKEALKKRTIKELKQFLYNENN